MLGTHQLFVGNEDRHEQFVSILSGLSGVFKLEVSSRTEAADGTYINDELFGTVQAWSKGWKVVIIIVIEIVVIIVSKGWKVVTITIIMTIITTIIHLCILTMTIITTIMPLFVVCT